MPRLAVASAPTSDTPSVRCSCGATNFASATPITPETSPTPTVWATATASRTTAHGCALSGPSWGSERKTSSAMPVQSGICARLKASLIGRWRRCKRKSDGGAGDLRGQQVAGDAKNSPRTRPISVSDSVCACFRNWMDDEDLGQVEGGREPHHRMRRSRLRRVARRAATGWAPRPPPRRRPRRGRARHAPVPARP